MARTGLAETRCRNLYEKATGNSTRGNRIGKGGRYPDGTTPPARPAKAKEAAVKKAAAKKAPAKKAPAAKGSAASAKLAKLTEISDIAEAVVGKVLTYKAGGKQTRTKVADLLDVVGEGTGMEITVQDNDDAEVTIAVSSIIKIAAR
jgi:pyruvate/2-oxoglutarate dehydrogenase complex dihydrolipoamide acyltransferase (E2) component